MKARLITLTLAVALVLALGGTASAHFLQSSADGLLLAWDYAYIRTPENVRCADVRYNGDYLVSNWKSVLSTATSNWNNNSNKQAAFFSETYSSSTLKLATWETWPSYLDSNAVAFTDRYDTNGTWLWNLDTGSLNTSFIHSVAGAHIYTNPAYSTNSPVTSGLKTLILGHEMGHVLGLEHPPAGTVSIMTQSQTSYSTPQAHDRTDMATLYPN